MAGQSFSSQLSAWLKEKGPKTFGDLEERFSEKTFAVIFLILMAPAALPLPTGGITHVTNLMTMLLSLEMIYGRRRIWTPKFWRQRPIGEKLRNKALPKLVSFIAWFEKRSQKRLTKLLNHGLFLRFVGILVFLFATGAFLAIPFSGLDTLPALGVVIISLALILDDVLVLLSGFLIGLAGIILEIGLGSAAIHFFHL